MALKWGVGWRWNWNPPSRCSKVVVDATPLLRLVPMPVVEVPRAAVAAADLGLGVVGDNEEVNCPDILKYQSTDNKYGTMCLVCAVERTDESSKS